MLRDEGENNYYIALELSDPQPDDGATYRVHAKNQHGESKANLTLNFDGKDCPFLGHAAVAARRSRVFCSKHQASFWVPLEFPVSIMEENGNPKKSA